MQIRTVGNSGLNISRLGLGTLTWGRDTDETEAADQLRLFIESGGNFLETSNSYGNGDSEKVIGGFLGTLVKRDELIIALRSGGSGYDFNYPVVNSKTKLIETLNSSLKRLGTDYVDLWAISNWDQQVPIEETLSAMEYGVQSGKVRYLGVSNYSGWQLARVYSLQNPIFGKSSIISCMNEYSLLNRSAETEVLPAAINLGIGFIAWSPLARGFLTGKYLNGIPADSRAASAHFAGFMAPYLNSKSKIVMEAVNVAASGLGYSPLEVALAWVRDNFGVTCALLGARNMAQLRGALTVEEIELPDEVRAALDEVSFPRS